MWIKPWLVVVVVLLMVALLKWYNGSIWSRGTNSTMNCSGSICKCPRLFSPACRQVFQVDLGCLGRVPSHPPGPAGWINKPQCPVTAGFNCLPLTCIRFDVLYRQNGIKRTLWCRLTPLTVSESQDNHAEGLQGVTVMLWQTRLYCTLVRYSQFY